MQIDDMCFSLGSRLFWQGSHVATLPPITPEGQGLDPELLAHLPSDAELEQRICSCRSALAGAPKGANGASLLKLGKDGFVDISKVSKGRGFQSLIHLFV